MTPSPFFWVWWRRPGRVVAMGLSTFHICTGVQKMSDYRNSYQSSSYSVSKRQENVTAVGADGVSAPVNWPELVAVRRRREIVIYKPDGLRANHKSPPTRKAINRFTEEAGGRLRRVIDNFWADFRVFGTLTYGAEYPRDCRVVKGHMRAFWERLRRVGYFDAHVLVWFLEFQARGAPHVHFVASGYISKEWLALAWSQITNGNRSACSRIEELRNARAAGAYAKKVSGYAAKAYQKEVPPDVVNVGRFWGVVGKEPKFSDMPLWFRKNSRGADGSTKAHRLPRVAAGTEKRHLSSMLVDDSWSKIGVKIYKGDHAVVVVGDESAITIFWCALMAKKAAENEVQQMRFDMVRKEGFIWG